MRGDSIRDLYAKTLAVAGLGLLAAAGAIVDYWPVGGQLPAVTSVASLRPRLPVLAKNVAIEIPVPSTAADATAERRTSPRRFDASLKTLMFAPTPLVSAAAIETPPAPEFAIAAPDSDAAAALVAGDILISVDLVAPPAADVAAAEGDDRPFLSGALQRTRDTLKDARSFLGSKLGNVVGAFRKVSPFWDSRTLSQFQ